MKALLLSYLPAIAGILLVASLVLGGYALALRYSNESLQATADRVTEQRDTLLQRTKVLEGRLIQARREVLEAQSIAAARAESSEKIRTVTKEITREVPTFLPAIPGPGGQPVFLPAGFGLLHDAAALGRPELLRTSSTSGADGAPVRVDSVATTVIDNYGTCRDNADRLEKLQDYVCSVAPDSASYCSQPK
ncbi:MAG: hypothetical protein ACK4K3_07505 [Aquabacterium sp.]